jgi:hypothetical protein
MKRSPIQTTLAGYFPNSYRAYLPIGCACRLTDNNYLIRAHARWNHPCLAAEANAPALNPSSRLMFIISHEAEKLACVCWWAINIRQLLFCLEMRVKRFGCCPEPSKSSGPDSLPDTCGGLRIQRCQYELRMKSRTTLQRPENTKGSVISVRFLAVQTESATLSHSKPSPTWCGNWCVVVFVALVRKEKSKKPSRYRCQSPALYWRVLAAWLVRGSSL